MTWWAVVTTSGTGRLAPPWQRSERCQPAGENSQRARWSSRHAAGTFRYAHEWSQHQAAHEWNQRWPDELKIFKSFSYWEQWPSRTGHAPTLDNLSKLAELYECAVSDLLIDLPNFRHRDSAISPPDTALTVCKPDVELVAPSDVAVWATATDLQLPDTFVAMLMQYLESLVILDHKMHNTPRDRAQAYRQLVQFLRSWAHTMDRRYVLRLLAWAETAAAVFSVTVSDEHERMASVLSRSSRVDAQTIEHIEAVLCHCRHGIRLPDLPEDPEPPASVGVVTKATQPDDRRTRELDSQVATLLAAGTDPTGLLQPLNSILQLDDARDTDGGYLAIRNHIPEQRRRGPR